MSENLREMIENIQADFEDRYRCTPPQCFSNDYRNACNEITFALSKALDATPDAPAPADAEPMVPVRVVDEAIADHHGFIVGLVTDALAPYRPAPEHVLDMRRPTFGPTPETNPPGDAPEPPTPQDAPSGVGYQPYRPYIGPTCTAAHTQPAPVAAPVTCEQRAVWFKQQSWFTTAFQLALCLAGDYDDRVRAWLRAQEAADAS